MTIEKVSDIVPQKRRGVIVAASPLNQVKLELGILIVVSVLLLLVIPTFISDHIVQLMIYAGYGVSAAVWLVVRVRRVVSRLVEQDSGKTH